MSVTIARGAFTDDFAYEATTSRERSVACGVALALALGFAALGGAAGLPGPHSPGLVTIVETTIVVACFFTSAMLASQYRIRRHAPLALLACGYGAFGTLNGLFLLTYPGVIATDALPSSAAGPWLMFAGRMGFAALAGAFVYVEQSRRRSARWHAGIVARGSVAAIGYVVVIAALVFLAHGLLPALMSSDGNFTAVLRDVLSPIAAFAQFGVAIAIVFKCGVTRRVHLWLAVVLFAMGLEAFASLVFGFERFTLGWYGARLDAAFAAMLFFCVMQMQLAPILQRADRKAERSSALHDIVSLGNENSADRNYAMLERAAQELHFDWACVARIEHGWVTLDTTYGEVPYEPGYRAPAGDAWHRDAMKRRAVSVVEEDVDVPWIDETPRVFSGWSTLVTVPVFVDGLLYGLAAFANLGKRDVALVDADRQFLQLLGQLAGVTIERLRQRSQLSALAYTDALTGLANRASLFEQLHKEVAISQRYGLQFAVHFLDLDGFKGINDTFGHAAGDEVLREVGRRLRGVVRESDTVARLGGDEFVVLQPRIEDQRAPERLAVRLREALAEPFPYEDQNFAIGTSIGTSRFPRDGSEIHALMDRADELLYRQKALRRRTRGSSANAVSYLKDRRGAKPGA